MGRFHDHSGRSQILRFIFRVEAAVMTRLLLAVACLPLLGAIAGLFHLQFTRKPRPQALLITTILGLIGFALAGAAAAHPAWLE
jgi:hypothetical protein